MKILITGIHGFVGSNIVKAMGRNHEIYGLDIVAPEKEGVVKTFSWNDLDENKIPQVDAVIHLAGKAHDLKKTSGPEIYFKINTGLTQKIYDWFLQSSAGKFIFFSSVKAAADFVPGDILTEDIVPHPVGPYGESKIKAEEYILSHPATGKQVYILRPCMIHGPGNKGNLNLLYGVVKKGYLGRWGHLKTDVVLLPLAIFALPLRGCLPKMSLRASTIWEMMSLCQRTSLLQSFAMRWVREHTSGICPRD